MNLISTRKDDGVLIVTADNPPVNALSAAIEHDRPAHDTAAMQVENGVVLIK